MDGGRFLWAVNEYLVFFSSKKSKVQSNYIQFLGEKINKTAFQQLISAQLKIQEHQLLGAGGSNRLCCWEKHVAMYSYKKNSVLNPFLFQTRDSEPFHGYSS